MAAMEELRGVLPETGALSATRFLGGWHQDVFLHAFGVLRLVVCFCPGTVLVPSRQGRGAESVRRSRSTVWCFSHPVDYSSVLFLAWLMLMNCCEFSTSYE